MGKQIVRQIISILELIFNLNMCCVKVIYRKAKHINENEIADSNPILKTFNRLNYSLIQTIVNILAY